MNCYVQGCEQEATEERVLARLDAFMEDGGIVRLPILTGWCPEHAVCGKVYDEFHKMFARATRQDAEIVRMNQMIDAEMTPYTAEEATEEELEQVEADEADLRVEIERAIQERLQKNKLEATLPPDTVKSKTRKR